MVSSKQTDRRMGKRRRTWPYRQTISLLRPRSVQFRCSAGGSCWLWARRVGFCYFRLSSNIRPSIYRRIRDTVAIGLAALPVKRKVQMILFGANLPVRLPASLFIAGRLSLEAKTCRGTLPQTSHTMRLSMGPHPAARLQCSGKVGGPFSRSLAKPQRRGQCAAQYPNQTTSKPADDISRPTGHAHHS